MTIVDLSKLPAEGNSLRDFLDGICETFELDYAAYAGLNTADGTVHAVATYPEEWNAYYIGLHMEVRDPTLAAASRSIAPVDWSRVRGDENFGTVFGPARDFGIPDQGMTVPVRGPYGDAGMLSVSRATRPEVWTRLKKKILPQLQMSAVHLHDHVMQTGTLMKILSQPALSLRELDVLQWVAVGKQQQDVADILGISNRTVEVHLRSARTKLGALTTTHAVARAIGMGLIYPT